MSTSVPCIASYPFDAQPVNDLRGFHAAVMAAEPSDPLTRALRAVSRDTGRLRRLFARDELAIFWPSWR